MKILSTYQNYNHKPAFGNGFGNGAIQLSSAELAKLPPKVQQRIKAAHLQNLVGNMDDAGQRVLAGILPEIVDAVKSIVSLVKRKKKGVSEAVAIFLSDTGRNLEEVVQKLTSTQEVLPKPVLKSAEVSAEDGVALKLVEMSAKRSTHYNTLNEILSDDECSAASVQRILDSGLLKPIKKEHRFELVEKMIEVATKRKNPELVGKLFNYVFSLNQNTLAFRVNDKNVINVNLCPTLMKFFNAGAESGNKQVIRESHFYGMDKSEGFNQELNNAAIEFAAKTAEMNFVKRVLIHTEANFDDAKPDREKLAGLIKKYLCAEVPQNIDRPNPPADVEFINALIPRMPNKLRKMIRENVAADLDEKLGKDRAKDIEKVLKWYFTPARKQVD